MEIAVLNDDISVFYITSASFPAGIMEAFRKLYELVPFSTERKFFGISRPEEGTIVYKAAAEEKKPGEAEKFGCDTLIVKKGRYISVNINDFMKDLPAVGNAFKEMLLYPGLDPQGYCVEWYFNAKDVKCMIRLAD